MHQAPVDLVAYLDNALGHHCPLCFFLELDNNECPHKHSTTQDVARPKSVISDRPYSFASTCSSKIWSDSTRTARRKGSDTSQQSLPPTLKRKASPTGTNLRELNMNHSRQPLLGTNFHALNAKQSQRSLLRTQQSDDRLREVYESQILSYLESPLSEFDPFKN